MIFVKLVDFEFVHEYLYMKLFLIMTFVWIWCLHFWVYSIGVNLCEFGDFCYIY